MQQKQNKSRPNLCWPEIQYSNYDKLWFDQTEPLIHRVRCYNIRRGASGWSGFREAVRKNSV